MMQKVVKYNLGFWFNSSKDKSLKRVIIWIMKERLLEQCNYSSTTSIHEHKAAQFWQVHLSSVSNQAALLRLFGLFRNITCQRNNVDLKANLSNSHQDSKGLIWIYVRSNMKLFPRPRPLCEPFYELCDIFLIHLGDFADM